MLGFSGSYLVKSVITATTGAYGESVGEVHYYAWQAVPDCTSQSCVVKVTSSTGSHTTFAYSNGKFLGTGSGSATCYDRTGAPVSTDPTTLHDTLVPATTSSPVTVLTGVVDLTASGLCGRGGTATFSYTLTRTGSMPPVTA